MGQQHRRAMVSEVNMSKLSAAFRPSAPDDRTFKSVCKANEYYAKKEYKLAIDEYTKALTLAQPSLDRKNASAFPALIFSNRSASYYQCKKWAEAIKDADQVIRLKPEWAKGYFRRAEANIQLEKYNDALEDYYIAQRKDPQNPQITLRIAKTLILKDNLDMNLGIYTLEPGKDICLPTLTNPILNKVFEVAVEMKNIIYIIADLETRKCIIIDACWDIDGILRFIKKKRLEPVGAIVTHYHFDHVGGHTEGSQSILVNETRLFTGDTLMVGCAGRIDLPGGSSKEMKKTLSDRLNDLEDGTVVYPGHNYGGEWTTIGIEREKGTIGKFTRK